MDIQSEYFTAIVTFAPLEIVMAELICKSRVHNFLEKWPRSITDSTKDSGSLDRGSIPFGVTTESDFRLKVL